MGKRGMVLVKKFKKASSQRTILPIINRTGMVGKPISRNSGSAWKTMSLYWTWWVYNEWFGEYLFHYSQSFFSTNHLHDCQCSICNSSPINWAHNDTSCYKRANFVNNSVYNIQDEYEVSCDTNMQLVLSYFPDLEGNIHPWVGKQWCTRYCIGDSWLFPGHCLSVSHQPSVGDSYREPTGSFLDICRAEPTWLNYHLHQ